MALPPPLQSLIVPGLALALGCASALPGVDAGGDAGAAGGGPIAGGGGPIAGGGGPIAGGGGPIAGGGGPIAGGGGSAGGQAPLPDLGSSGCAPGTRIGLCVVCGLDGVPTMAQDDDECPQASCSAYDRYENQAEGNHDVCYQLTFTPPGGGNCVQMGQCIEPTLEEADCVATREEVARDMSTCTVLTGCAAEEPPELREQPVSTPCNGTGQCQAGGRCSIGDDPRQDAGPPEPGICDRFVEAFPCGDGENEAGQAYCQFRAHRNPEQSCDSICQGYGTFCLDAWTTDAACDQVAESDCNTRLRQLICRCALL